jgi:hypothetical protein
MMKSIPKDELDAAMPSLVEKLKQMRASLTPEQRAPLDEIIRSASDYSREHGQVQSNGARYAKPKSTSATLNMKRQIASLADTLR